jgi:predicted adenylyl cyclase CyaB
MQNIEVEIRSFLTEEQYKHFLEYFKQNSEFINEDYQETYYFDGEQDLRIQKNNFYAKIWLKSGKIHDEQREETEIKFDKNDFFKAEQLFLNLGYKTQIKWFRTRNVFKWQDIVVTIDYSKGYGYIIELEKMSDEENKNKDLEYLKNKMAELQIVQTPKEEFDAKYNFYKKHWEELTK